MIDIKQLKQSIDLRTVIQLEGQRQGTNYIYGFCPFHEGDGKDHTPSFLVYRDHYVCLSPKCGQVGDIINWTAWKRFSDPKTPLLGAKFGEIIAEISKKIEVPVLHTGVVSNFQKTAKKHGFEHLENLSKIYFQNLLASPKRLAYFYSRGFVNKTIRRQQFGWDGSNYTIPVWEGIPRQSKVLSIRLRASQLKAQRYSGVTGYNQQMLYNREVVLVCNENRLPFILIFYGELDAALALQDCLPAVSPTNGALSFLPEWLGEYNGEKIFVPDKKEERAGRNDANSFGSRGWMVEFPRGDFKDYGEFRQAGYEGIDLLKIIWQQVPVVKNQDFRGLIKRLTSSETI